jgi:hypothetical protein
MRYGHFDMLPEKAFQPVGKRMTLEGGGFGGLGGLGSVLGTAGSIAAGGSPLGAFGSTLGSQLLQGGGGGGGSGGAGNVMNDVGGVGNQNQTQIVGPLAGMNPASIPYQQELLRMQQQQQEQQQAQQPTAPVQPQVQQPALTQTPAQMGLASLMPQQSASPSNQQTNVLNAINSGSLRGMGPKGLGGVGPGRPPMRGGMAGKGGGVAYPQQGGMAGKGGNVPKQMLNKTFGGLG